MYRKIISIDNLTKELDVAKFFIEDGTYILKWNNREYFNDTYELHGYKVFMIKSYNYFNNKLGIINSGDDVTYVVLIKITDSTKIDNDYEYITNVTDNYSFTYKLGMLYKVECLNRKSGFVRYSEYLDDYSYNIIESDWLDIKSEKILVVNSDHKIKFKVRSNKVTLCNDNGNSIIYNNIEDIRLIFKSYPKFNYLKNYLISLVL